MVFKNCTIIVGDGTVKNKVDIEIEKDRIGRIAENIRGEDSVDLTGGHGGWLGGREADGVDECRKAAREQLKDGADFLKIMATGGVLTKGSDPDAYQLEVEEMMAIVHEAKKVGKKTAAHAINSNGVVNAAKAAHNLHGENAGEFKYLVEFGLEPMQALCAGAGFAAEALSLSKVLGTVETGKLADLVVLGGNPLDDISAVTGDSIPPGRGA